MSSFTRISPADAKAMIDAGDVNIADIRDAMSYQSGHMTASRNVDNSNLPEFLAATSKDQPLIVCCYHGNSSQQAAQFFAEQGYTQAYSLDGGYEMWKVSFPELCAQGQD
ncbi:thiosulfate sulfurtransferase GlpE [Oceanobacter kriegii]|uniref:thiosulfate sulfurtransferase GlpE n=1 Tax=Oceanobacter kriegii TaxID=64972 RepID=UPI00042689E2|nr:thiosulfate sulfurtransferase GlpE [Oceanobacter kriegii]